MIPLYEPVWGQNLVVYLNDFMKYSDFLIDVAPITADVFVFLFPVLLVILYVLGLIKKNDTLKESALWVFWSAIITSIVNVCIQFFFLKERPSTLWFGDSSADTILHKFLPNSSFPSDHAAMSMGFAIGLLILGIKSKNTIYKVLGIIFLLFALMTGISRIMVGVHRPTDIIGGFVVGIFVPLLLSYNGVYKLLKKILIMPLIKFQKMIIKR